MPLTTDENLLAPSREAIEVFDKVNGGVHPGFRPAHAKGIVLTGTFTPSPEAASLTRAPHLQRNSTPVTVRFSDATGIPTIADNDPQHAAPRGFAVRFHLGTHIHTDIISQSVDAFPARTAEGLIEFLNAVIATDPAGPHPNAIEQFLAACDALAAFSRSACWTARSQSNNSSGLGGPRSVPGHIASACQPFCAAFRSSNIYWRAARKADRPMLRCRPRAESDQR